MWCSRLFGPNSDTEWTVEGRRVIPLISRLKGRTAYTTFANSLSLTTAIANERQPLHTRKQDGWCFFIIQIIIKNNKFLINYKKLNPYFIYLM